MIIVESYGVTLTWKMISDPLYGYVYFNTEIEESIINSMLLQRLRYIMQLQTAHFVYPGAVHTRFQHSIGTMHIAGLMAEDMVSKIMSLYGQEALEGYSPLTLVEASRLAGLLHDVGHAAFSHAFEHEILWKKNLPREVSNHERIGLYLVRQLLEEELDKAEKLLPGLKNALFSLLGVDEPKGVLRPFKWIVKEGYYPADVLDFLRRDSYYAGTVEYGSILYERLYKNTYPLMNGSTVALVLDRTALGEFKRYMYAKANMYEHVYYHSVCRSFDKILYELLNILEDEMNFTKRVLSIIGNNPEDYLELTDALLYTIMMQKALRDGTRVGYLCRKMLIERKPEWKRVGREVSVSASKGPESLEKALMLILDSEYRDKVVKVIEEHLEDRLRSRSIEGSEIWVDVLDITPLPKTLIYPGGEVPRKMLTLYVGKKIGKNVVVSEDIGVLLEELPLEVVFRVYTLRSRYSAELEPLVTSLLMEAVSSSLGIDINATKRVFENIYMSYVNRDYSKYRLTL